jgi:hypothetical protein
MIHNMQYRQPPQQFNKYRQKEEKKEEKVEAAQPTVTPTFNDEA